MNRSHISLVGISATALLLSGCTTFGTNVSGSFTCEAPDGICAPSTTIDDSAIASIEETSSTELMSPAGPFELDDGIERPVIPVQVANTPSMTQGAPTYKLSIVFPGYVDASGNHHQRRTRDVDAALPGRGGAMGRLAHRGRSRSRNRGLLAAAESAPAYLALTAAQTKQTQDAMEGAASTQAASASTSNPITRIQEQVERKLSTPRRTEPRSVRRQAASFSGTVE